MVREWLKVVLLILCLCLPAALSAGELPVGCRNEIQSLGGKNAVIRTKGDPTKRLDTREKLDALLFNEKRADGKPNKIPAELDQLLKDQGFEFRIKDLKLWLPNEPKSYNEGQLLEWMAVRRNGVLGVVTSGCWGGPEPFLGWEFFYDSGGVRYWFVIPVDCLNLALIRREVLPLFCDVKIEASCGEKPSATVKLKWTPGLPLKTKSDPLLKTGTSGEEVHQVAFSEGQPFEIEATVKRDNGDSATCSAAALVCPGVSKEVPDDKYVWNLKLEANWELNVLRIDVLKDGIPPDNCSNITIIGGETKWVGGRCEIIIRQEITGQPKCCDENWLVRGVGVYSGTHGSATEFGTNPPMATHIDTSAGAGLGIEAEYFWEDESKEGEDESKEDRTLPGKGWGVPMGITYSKLRYSYMRDTPEVWIMDEEDTSAFFVYSGISRRFELGEKTRASIGPVIGLYRSGDASFIDVGSKTLDLDFGWSFAYGANVTFDWYLDECWGITFGATYLEAEVDDGIDIEINPLLFRFGFVNRF